MTTQLSGRYPIVASRLCDEAKPGQILISARVLTKVENAVKVEPIGEFELKGIRRPLAAYNVVAALASGDQFAAANERVVAMKRNAKVGGHARRPRSCL